MKHVEADVMSDYVNGLLDDEIAQRVAAHLQAGCGRCEALSAALSRVAALAEADAGLDLPAGVVRSAKAFFAVRRAQRLPARRWLALRPIGEGAPAPVGVRGGSTRQRFTYGCESLELEIVLEATPGREAVDLSGELVDRRRGHLAGVPAFLTRGETLVDRGTTDELGSFALAVESVPARLSLVLEDERLIALEVRGPDEPAGPWSVRPARPSAA